MKKLTLRLEDNDFEQFAQEARDKKISLSDCLRNYIRDCREKNILKVKLSDDEIEKIKVRLQDESVDLYLTQLVQKDLDPKESSHGDQAENSKTEGDEAVTKIDFRALLGEEIFTKVHAEAGDNLQEYLQKILLRQTNENAIIVDCPEDELQKIDALRNDKSRQEYLRELIAKDKNVELPRFRG